MSTLREPVEVLEIHYPPTVDSDQYITVFTVGRDGTMTLLDSMEIGPFPDWEAIGRRIMRHCVRTGAAN